MIKIYKIDDVKKFLEVVDKCDGDVYLLTRQGDRLNLKSKLSQYVALADVMGVNSEFVDLEIETENKNDNTKIIEFLAGAI